VVELALSGRRALAERLDVRSAPTVLFVDAGGRVVYRWARPPERAELARVLEERASAPYAPAAAASR
jgi:hypothetical protein